MYRGSVWPPEGDGGTSASENLPSKSSINSRPYLMTDDETGRCGANADEERGHWDLFSERRGSTGKESLSQNHILRR